MTGEQVETEIFMGPNYYMRLKHMVKDKINYRALGPRTALTKQPVSGRANDGGLRIGEMERDVVIAHGAADFLRESIMERGDKYQLAVCNTTGLIAIYNPAKNIFMSPMADGPLRFFTSMDGKETHVENITKFGRSFSIVNVPYSLKLLIQELQTINIQMRIITEDNIKQLENMSYSDNIGKLLFDEKMTPNQITRIIRREIESRRTRTDVYATPENKVYENESPEYAFGSPAFVPPLGENNVQETSPRYNPFTPQKVFSPTSPDFPPPQPTSPDFPPPATTPDFPPPSTSPQFPPPSTSPDFPPPDDLQEGGVGPIKFKKDLGTDDETAKYNIEERVHYRGDFMPTRLWKIVDIGDHFITIEADNSQGLEPMDTTKIVMVSDIYRPGYNMNSLPFEEPLDSVPGLYNSFDQMNYSTVPMKHPVYQPTGPASIHFAPVIKVLNGGNDFSDQASGEGGAITEAKQQSSISDITTSLTGGNISKTVSADNSVIEGGPLIVKKV
jgi:hypothetical protein